jgi:multidrug efflux pump subunit AcrB
MSLAIVLMSVVAIARIPADVFPDINIPIVSVIWTYTGVSPDEMADVVTTRAEKGLTTRVTDIEHIESETLAGLAVIKVFFHPNVKIEAAVAQVTASSQSIIAQLPPSAHMAGSDSGSPEYILLQSFAS